jgi:hypothetical protein
MIDVIVASTNETLAFAVKKPDGTAKDLTNYSGRILWSLNGGAQVARTLTITDPSNGYVEYVTLLTDITSGGMLHGEIEVTATGGQTTASKYTFKREVRSRVGT